jgi:hypothetical protein
MTTYKNPSCFVCSLIVVLYQVAGCSKTSPPIEKTEIANSVWETVDQDESKKTQWFFRGNGTFMHIQGTNAFKGTWKFEKDNFRILILELAMESGKIARFFLRKDPDGLLVGDWRYFGAKSQSKGNIQLKRFPGSPPIP